MKLKATYEVTATPMTLGEYCDQHWTTDLTASKRAEPGFMTTYDLIDPATGNPAIGWMAVWMFETLFTPVEV
jgi:hypothetical protein